MIYWNHYGLIKLIMSEPIFTPNPENLKSFYKVLRFKSLGLWEEFTESEVSVFDINIQKHKEQVLKNQMSFILLCGKTFNLYFRCFFNYSDLRSTISKTSGTPVEEITPGLIQDFINEYCNLMAGSIKNIISLNMEEEAVGLSLPLVVPGFESWYFGLNRKVTNYFFWGLKNSNSEIICSAELEELREFNLGSFNNLKIELSDKEEDYFDL